MATAYTFRRLALRTRPNFSRGPTFPSPIPVLVVWEPYNLQPLVLRGHWPGLRPFHVGTHSCFAHLLAVLFYAYRARFCQ
jgi:hypothetical protein